MHHSGSNAYIHDPATDQTILTSSEPQPPTYDAIPVAQYLEDQRHQGPTDIAFNIITFLVVCFILYNSIKVISIVGRGTTTPV